MKKKSHGVDKAELKGKKLLILSLAALGVVFGDIGTSPLYAVRESFGTAYGLKPSPENVLGILSLILWSLIIVISIKYLVFVMGADLDGEGGVLALTALVTPTNPNLAGRRWVFVLLGIFGAALLYGDGMITPAISVLAATEGLKEISPALEPFIIPITVGILIALFSIQSRGTTKVGVLFGPITLVWFIVIGFMGMFQIIKDPLVLAAVNPIEAIMFFLRNSFTGFLVLGSIFLVVTGGEALYADMGHFGVKPMRLAWVTLVLPALLLNYFGQGALIILDPNSAKNPFFLMAPRWALYPLVILATLATIIASQAVISGAFSLTKQAIQLGYLPRMKMKQTSNSERGQIYIPMINWLIMLASIGLVIGFRSSSNLASAYGVGVTTNMIFTTVLFTVLSKTVWSWSWFYSLSLSLLFLVFDLGFWAANLLKIPTGGWFPLLVAALFFVLMTTWKRGRARVSKALRKAKLPIETFLKSIETHPPTRVPGTAIFMTISSEFTPSALLSSLRYYHVLHERVILLTVKTEDIPRVLEVQRRTVTDLGNGFYKLVLHFGYMEQTDVPKALASIMKPSIDEKETVYFLGRERILAASEASINPLRQRLFVFMHRNSQGAPAFFYIPPSRVVEVGTQVEI